MRLVPAAAAAAGTSAAAPSAAPSAWVKLASTPAAEVSTRTGLPARPTSQRRAHPNLTGLTLANPNPNPGKADQPEGQGRGGRQWRTSGADGVEATKKPAPKASDGAKLAKTADAAGSEATRASASAGGATDAVKKKAGAKGEKPKKGAPSAEEPTKPSKVKAADSGTPAAGAKAPDPGPADGKAPVAPPTGSPTVVSASQEGDVPSPSKDLMLSKKWYAYVLSTEKVPASRPHELELGPAVTAATGAAYCWRLGACIDGHASL